MTKKDEIRLDKARLCLLGASTLDTYRTMFTSQYTDIGFLNRFFVVIGSSERKFSIPLTIPAKEKQALKEDLKQVLGFVGSLSANGCYAMPITPEALSIFDAWYKALGDSIFTKRLDTYGHRLMPLLAVNEMKDRITPEIAKRVVVLLNYQLAARRFADPIDADNAVAKLEERIRRLLDNGPMKKRDLERFGNRYRVGSAKWDKAIEGLKKAGEIAVDVDGKTKVYRRSGE